jgi:tripartite-type tricarboxylate transporter receptor subunit TctC
VSRRVAVSFLLIALTVLHGAAGAQAPSTSPRPEADPFTLRLAQGERTRALEGSGQPYPVKPVRVIVPNAPGGLADTAARLAAGKLAETLGQQFIVDNRPGAGGTIGTAGAVKAVPDGYTLLIVFDSHVTNPHLFRNLEYDTANDLAPVSLLVRGPLVLVVNPRLPVKTAGDFLRLARAKPGAINCATVGPGSPARLLVELLKLTTGVNVTQVPYKGAALALTDLVGGHVEAMFATVPSIRAHWKAGRLRALAVTSDTVSGALPGVPPLNQTIAGFTAESWVGLLAPAKTPPELIARLNAEVLKVLNMPDVRERFAEQGLETVGSSAADFDRRIRAELERWGKVIRAAKITLE